MCFFFPCHHLTPIKLEPNVSRSNDDMKPSGQKGDDQSAHSSQI